MASRSSEIRTFVRQMSKIHQCDMDVEYHDARRYWVINWHDGPTREAVLAAIQRQLPEHKDIVYTGRYLSDEATVLGAIRCYVSGEVHRWNDLRYAAERLLEDVAFPLRTATARESAMVERLLEESAQDRPWGRDRNADHALELLTERKGIGWLFTPAAAPDGRQPEADGHMPPALAPLPVELLTARYARGDHSIAWRERAAPMPLAEAFAAALADEEIDRDAALAALTLVADLQAVLDANTATLMARARGAGGSWSDVGQALGRITKQSAAKKYGVLTRPAKRPSASG
ncbi:hypothetical protein [Kitasatospora aburaviensis]|uniref:Uncharacterized protein n=1 Tax=Kitasatospora aburaviensis TaxID=67265 RepID=A0ABW1EXB5_9ACTN